MSWADRAIKDLQAGNSTKIRPHGGSMRGKVESGQLVTLDPVEVPTLAVGDIVLCRVKGNIYLHLVKAKQEGRVLIGNNRGGTNGWTRTVYGLATKVED